LQALVRDIFAFAKHFVHAMSMNDAQRKSNIFWVAIACAVSCQAHDTSPSSAKILDEIVALFGIAQDEYLCTGVSCDESHLMQRSLSYMPLSLSGEENLLGPQPAILDSLDALQTPGVQPGSQPQVDLTGGMRLEDFDQGAIKPVSIQAAELEPTTQGISLEDAMRNDHPEAVLGGLMEMVSMRKAPQNGASTKISAEVLEWILTQISARSEQLITVLHTVLAQTRVWEEAFGVNVSTKVQEFFSTMEKVIEYYNYFVPDLTDSGMVLQVVQEFLSEVDIQGKGYVLPEDLLRVGEKFGILALSSEEEILSYFASFDSDGDGKLQYLEVAAFLTSEDGRNIGTKLVSEHIVQLSSVLGALSGETARGPLRKSMAEFVVATCENNASMATYMSKLMGGQALTEPCVTDDKFMCSFAMPLNFSAEVLGQLAIIAHRVTMPEQADSVGRILLTQIHEYSNTTLTQIFDTLIKTEWWEDMGFPVDQHAEVIETVTRWAIDSIAPSLKTTDAVLYSTDGRPVYSQRHPFAFCDSDEPGTCPSRAREVVEGRVARHRQAMHLTSLLAVRNTTDTHVDLDLNVRDTEMLRIFKSGQLASNETLRVVAILTRMFTSRVRHFENVTRPVVNVAASIAQVSRRFDTFLRLFHHYSTPEGSYKLEQTIRNFTSQITGYIHVILNISDSIEGSFSLLSTGNKSQAAMQEAKMLMNWDSIERLLDVLSTILPPMVEDLQRIRSLVLSSASRMDTVFDKITRVGPTAILTFATTYRAQWIAHYLICMSFLAIALVFSLYARYLAAAFSGDESDEYVAPQTFLDRLKAFLGSMITSFHVVVVQASDSYMLFWSVLLLAQFGVLILANSSLVLASFAGVEMFALESCKTLHIVNNENYCNTVLDMVAKWIPAFDDDILSCRDTKLLSCALVQEKLWMSMSATTCFNIVATLLSFQLIIDAGVNYEYMYWRRRVTDKYAVLDFVGKNPEKEE